MSRFWVESICCLFWFWWTNIKFIKCCIFYVALPLLRFSWHTNLMSAVGKFTNNFTKKCTISQWFLSSIFLKYLNQLIIYAQISVAQNNQQEHFWRKQRPLPWSFLKTLHLPPKVYILTAKALCISNLQYVNIIALKRIHLLKKVSQPCCNVNCNMTC